MGEIIKKGNGKEMARHSGLRLWVWAGELIHVIHETTTPGGKNGWCAEIAAIESRRKLFALRSEVRPMDLANI